VTRGLLGICLICSSRDSAVAHVTSAELEARLKLEPPHRLNKNDNNDGDESVRIFASHSENHLTSHLECLSYHQV
jgi:hypothetical protein